MHIQTSVNPSDVPTTSAPTLRPEYAPSLQPTKNSMMRPTENTLDLSGSMVTTAHMPQVNASVNSAAGPVTCSLVTFAASLTIIMIT